MRCSLHYVWDAIDKAAAVEVSESHQLMFTVPVCTRVTVFASSSTGHVFFQELALWTIFSPGSNVCIVLLLGCLLIDYYLAGF